MKLFYSPASPFVRKVQVAALELGLDERIEKLRTAAHPVTRDASIVVHNPTGRVPALLTDEGEVLYDSHVICEYLDALGGAPRLFPAPGPERWRALREEALGNGLLEACLAVRYETLVRPAEFQWTPWVEGQRAKILSSLDAIEAVAAGLGDRFDIGTLTLACTLGYLDFRFQGQIDWRHGRPASTAWFSAVSRRTSLQTTLPHDWPTSVR